MTRRRGRARLAGMGLAALLGLGGASPLDRAVAQPVPSARPSRIVSLNLCTDELLLRLVDRDRIASVTWLSQDPVGGNMAAQARLVPANHGLAEEVLAVRPDLVVAGRYTTRTTVALLKRAGIPVVEFGAPETLPDVEAQIGEFSRLVGEPARGEALVAAMRARLDRLPPAGSRPKPGAFVLRPNGFTAARGSLVDDILTRAGLDNLAARLDLGHYGQVPLETVVLEHARILVVDAPGEGPPSIATAILRHPVLTKLRRQLVEAAVPSRLWTCAGPGVVEAIERLHAIAVAP